MCISTVLVYLINVICELSVLMMVESYFRCAVKIFHHEIYLLYFGCVILGPGGVSICVLLLTLCLKVLFDSQLLGVIDLLSF